MVIDQGQVSVTDLAKATGVSEVTIRQDLNTLEKLSYLRREMCIRDRRCNVRILRDGQCANSQNPRQHNQNGDNPGKDLSLIHI